MSSWTDGYVNEILYTTGFYRELTPAMLSFAAMVGNMLPPALDEGATYCELGCGMGFSTNLLAAANPHIRFFATDFNPAQVVHAQALARDAGTPNVTFFDAAFSEFADISALPSQFDVIALHGIYSWISTENRRHIVQFIKKKLKPGGLVYISYNSMPGWAPAMPLRQLMLDHFSNSAGPISARIDSAIAFIEGLEIASARYFVQNPSLKDRISRLKGMSRNYLAHEFLNRDWTPFYFKDLVRELDEAKLDFGVSASVLDNVESINLTKEHRDYISKINGNDRQSIKDILTNQQFRKDIFVKGRVLPSLHMLREFWKASRFALSTPSTDIALKVTGYAGEAGLAEEIYKPILSAFAQGPSSIQGLIDTRPELRNLSLAQFSQALVVLVGAGHLQPCLPAREDQKRSQRTRAFNAALMQRAETSSDFNFLASPVTGGGVQVDRFSQLFLAARAQKVADPVAFVWRMLSEQGQRLVKDGKPIETAEDNLAQLRTNLTEFNEKRLPILQQLGIA
jgi:SAM-dependent methyltransferase